MEGCSKAGVAYRDYGVHILREDQADAEGKNIRISSLELDAARHGRRSLTGVRDLNKPILAAADEFQKAQVAQDLQLLPDFVADVAVAGMEPG